MDEISNLLGGGGMGGGLGMGMGMGGGGFPGDNQYQQQVPRAPDLPMGSERATGFRRLAGISGLFVRQEVEWMEAFTGFETANKYTVLGNTGHPTFYAVEEGSWITRNLCGKHRPFTLRILNPDGSQFLTITRPFRFYFQEIEVRSCQDGSVLGYIMRTCSVCSRDYTIYNHARVPILKIKGPCWNPWAFFVRTLDGQELGAIRKKWSGLAKEFFTDADNFGVQFPADLALNVKALILAAVFLIDFMYFEDNAGSSYMRGNRQRRY